MQQTERVRGRRRALALSLVSAIVLALLTVAAPAVAPARAAGPLAVDSVVWNGGPDVTPGDGVCADSAGRCTLRAALQEANALGGNVVVTVASTFAGGAIVVPDCDAANYMVTTGVPLTTTAYYAITAPNIVLDLQNKISISSADCASAGLYINGSGASVQNSSGFLSGQYSFVVGSGGSGALLANLTQIQTANYNAERSIVVASGANNVTVRGSTFAGFSDPAAAGSVVYVAPGATVSNLRILANTFTNDQSVGGQCTAVDARGCRNNGILVGAGATVTGLTIQGNTFSNYDSAIRSPINLGSVSAALSGLDISGNVFTNTSNTNGSATISLPPNATMAGTNVISQNTFRANAGSVLALYWDGAITNGGTRSNLTVSDNYFDGYGSATLPTIQTLDAGSVPFERNTFGPASVGSVAAAGETGANTLVNNNNANSNSAIRTRYPSTTPTINNTACTASFTATSGGTTLPVLPIRVDVFWSATGTQGAEIFLGSGTVTTTAAQTITVPYTSGTAGLLRVQSQGAARVAGSQLQSSQYSRTVAIAASTCKPAVTVEQAGGQADPTNVRTVRFTVRSSARLNTAGAGSLQAADFSTAGSTAPGVVVTGVTAFNARLYEVTATASDSGTIVLSLPAGVVADATSGATNTASTSSDNSVTYQNPLTRAPAALTVYQGAPAVPYAITRDATLPPTSALSVGVTASNAFVTAPASVTVSTADTTTSVPVASAANLGGATRTATLTHVVTSSDPNYNGLLLPSVAVTANLAATLTPTSGPTAGGQSVAFTVNYLPAAVTAIAFDGLTAAFTGSGGSLTATTPPRPSPTGINVTVDVALTYANGTVVVLPGAYTYVPQPAISVVKTAYTDAARTQQVAVDADVLSGQQVYWTYTVQNPGQTPLSDVTVVDPQLPAATYPGGLVCTVPTIAIGATASCTANAVVGP